MPVLSMTRMRGSGRGSRGLAGGVWQWKRVSVHEESAGEDEG